jgi:neutral ceramidase
MMFSVFGGSMRAALKVYVLMLMLAGMGLPMRAAQLEAAVAKVDITPPAGLDMWGFAARKGPSTGTLDPLYARVLVLAAGDKRAAIVTLDLGRTFGPASLERLESLARKSSNIGYLLAAASHTHSGPIVSDNYDYAGGRPPAWEDGALTHIAEAIDSASKHLVPVRLGMGYGATYVGYNRLQTKLDHSPQFFARDPTQIISSPVDPTVGVLRIDTEDGQPMAILVNYACHAVVLGAENERWSADWPAAMAKTVEAAFPSHPVTFFMQGGAGDIDPYYANTATQQDPVRWRDWTGDRVGEEAVRVAKTIETKDEPDGSLDFADDRMTVKTRWDIAKFDESFHRVFNPHQFPYYDPHLKPETTLRTTTLLINKRMAFMSMSGEPFVDLQIDWRNRCPVHDSFFVGYANGYNGYIPTIDGAVRGGYGGASSTTWIGVDSGSRMVDHSVVRIDEMLGKLVDAPM